MRASGLSRRTAAFAVLLLTLLAVGLRARGLDFQLPQYTQSDGLILADQVERARTGTEAGASYGTVARTYPHLASKVALLLPDGRRREPTRGLDLSEHAALATSIWMDLRWVSVLAGALLVPLTYALARLFLGRGPAVFAAALITTSMLHMSLSQMERPHALAASAALLAVLCAVRLARRPTPGSYLLTGLAVGLALGSLQSGAAALLPLAAAWLVARRNPQRAAWWWPLVSLALVALCVRWLYPFHFERPPQTPVPGTPVPGGGGVFNLSGHSLELGALDGGGFLRVLATLYSYEPMLLVLALAGLVSALRAWFGRSGPLPAALRRDLFVTGAYALPYLLALGLYGLIYERFVIQLLPFLACLAAFAGARWMRGRSRSAAAALGLCLLAPPTALTWKLGSVRGAPDTVAQAAAWLQEHAEAERDRIFVVPHFTFPLFYGPASSEWNWRFSQHTTWLTYQHDLEAEEWTGPRYEIFHPGAKRALLAELSRDPLGYFASQRASYVVLQQVSEGFRIRALPETREALGAGAELVLRLSPMTVDSGRGERVETRYMRNVLRAPCWLHTWRARCMGPTLEIYRLP